MPLRGRKVVVADRPGDDVRGGVEVGEAVEVMVQHTLAEIHKEGLATAVRELPAYAYSFTANVQMPRA